MKWKTKITALFVPGIDKFALPALLVLFALLSFALKWTDSDYLKSLGPNLVAGFIGSGVTVYGVEYLQKRREERRMLPVKAAIYEDVRLIARWAMDLWRHAYISSVGDSAPQSWAGLLSEESIAKIRAALDFDKPVGAVPDVLWRDHFKNELTRIHDLAEKLLTRHGLMLEPNAYSAVHCVAIFNFGTVIEQSETVHRRLRIKWPSLLAFYGSPHGEWFEAVLAMHMWTISEYQTLVRKGLQNLREPHVFVPLKASNNPAARFVGPIPSSPQQTDHPN